MDTLDTPLFDDTHRDLGTRVRGLCQDRLQPLSNMELDDAQSAVVEYAALLGQEGLFDPALGRALEGEAPRPDLRSLCIVRELLARMSGLCDAAYGAQVQGMFPIALSGDEDQRAIHLPMMASGQTVVALALLDGGDGGPATATKTDDGYVLTGSKSMVPLAPIADRFCVLARHAGGDTPRFSLFVVDKGQTTVVPESFVSPMPVGMMTLNDAEVDEEARLGGEGQGLVIAQATLDMFRLPTASACVGLGGQVLHRGTRELLKRGVAGRRLKDLQACQWQIADAVALIEAARALIVQSAHRRDTSSAREIQSSAIARQLAQEAAEQACQVIADLVGQRALKGGSPWARLPAEVRALRLEGDFLENTRNVIARVYMQAVDPKAAK